MPSIEYGAASNTRKYSVPDRVANISSTGSVPIAAASRSYNWGNGCDVPETDDASNV